jgi:hypothetical protein
MSKKKKKNKSKKRNSNSKQTAPTQKRRSKYPLFAMIAGGVLVLMGAYYLYQGINLQENRPTLSPARFSGKVRRAYEIARAMPEVLDRLYCYCRCKENFAHENLLSCYVDTHAST